MRILALAAEGWETKLVSGVLADWRGAGRMTRARLALTDIVTFQYDRPFLQRVKSIDGVEVDTLEELFVSWQASSAQPAPPVENTRDWIARTNSRFDRESLLASDIILSAWERQQWLLDIDDEWRERIAADQLHWTEKQFNEVEPDVVIAVERRRLPSLAAQAIAEYRDIPMLTLLFTRIGSRYMVRTDAGIGMSPFEMQRLKECPFSEASKDEAAILLQRVRDGAPLYVSLARFGTENESRRQQRSRSSRPGTVPFAIDSVRKALKSALVRHLHPRGGVRAQRVTAIRYEQRFRGLTRVELRVAMKRMLLALNLDGRYRATGTLSGQPYVLWLLHTRPEDGVSSMGGGVDEVELVAQVAAALPAGVSLLVKENPSMVGLRTPDFFRRMKESRVELLSPTSDTGELMASASGVAGISGTALLEATIMGLPTLALGRPEFLPCVPYRGLASLNDFVECVVDKAPLATPPILMSDYVAWVLENSDAVDMFWGDLDTPAGAAMIESVASRYWRLASLAGGATGTDANGV